MLVNELPPVKVDNGNNKKKGSSGFSSIFQRAKAVWSFLESFMLVEVYIIWGGNINPRFIFRGRIFKHIKDNFMIIKMVLDSYPFSVNAHMIN